MQNPSVCIAAAAVFTLAFGAVGSAQNRAPRDADRDTNPRRFQLFDRGSAIGVAVRDLSKEELVRTKQSGALIERVDERGPGAVAGLKEGDIVVELDGEHVRSARNFARLIEETPGGRTVAVVIMRNGSRQTVDITPETGGRMSPFLSDFRREMERGLRALPRDFDLEIEGPRIGLRPRGRLGVAVEPLTDQLAEYFGAKQGVLVSSVEPESPASKAGMRAGDVITGINGRTVDDPSALSAAVRTVEPGSTLDIAIVRDKKPLSLKAAVPDRPARRLVEREKRI